jgi:hypothetical protein
MTATLFEEAVNITEQYLGPAARRFVTRQIAFHLNKSPENLTPLDIPELVEWTKATLALLTEDKQMVSDYAAKISRLGEQA